MMASCALRSLAAATIFMALVICRVFFTVRMRLRMSRRDAMGPVAPVGFHAGASPHRQAGIERRPLYKRYVNRSTLPFARRGQGETIQ